MKIALSGASGSGKSRIARYLHERHGFAPTSTGEICRQIAILLFGDEDKGSLNRVSEMVRSLDPSLFIAAALRNVEGERVVLDSVRYLSDVERVRAAGFLIWRIECSPEERSRRLAARGQSVSTADLAHASEVELQSAVFDAVINNDHRSSSQLERDLDARIQT